MITAAKFVAPTLDVVDAGKRGAVSNTSDHVVEHTHIRALDGLRFLAAANVMVAHGFWFIVLMQDDNAKPGVINQLILSGASIGMTLFFVLSGFVIHYNYHRTVPGSRSGVLQFYIARFARLYPLFLVVFLCDFTRILWEQGYFSGVVFKLYDPFKALPLYLSFTQTWWWWPFQGTSAYEYYATWTTGATSVMWSLSTETFFYLVYPLFAGLLSRLSGRGLAIFAFGSAFFGLAYYTLGESNSRLLAAWAAQHFPDAPHEQFVHWFLFQSPWGRISEFLLGASAAQAFLVSSRDANHPSRFRLSRWLGVASLAAFIIPVFIIFGFFVKIETIGTQIFASFVAIFAFAVARYSSRISSLLSRPLLIRLGNASYSLYLIHYFFLHDYGQALVERYPQIPRSLIYFAMMALCAVLSLISYRVIERPAIRFVRANFMRLRCEIYLPAAFAVVTIFSILLSIHITALANEDPLTQPGHIAISSASFGDNCSDVLHDNILGLMRRVCGNQRSCAFDYDIEKIKDPAGGCEKRFDVIFTCGPLTLPREFLIDRFNKRSMPIELSCY